MRINNLFEPTEDITLESYLSKCGIDTNEYLKFRTNERYEHYPNIKKAVQAIEKTAGDFVYILSDSDIDGALSSSMFTRFYKEKYGYNLIPLFHMTPKSHGLTDKPLMDYLLTLKPSVLIIPDAGSNDIKQMKQLSDLGWLILCFDHHEIESENPYCILVSNQFKDSKVENKYGSGTLVTFKVMQAIDKGLAKKYVPYVAISLISDSMNLTSNENGTFLRWGLDRKYLPQYLQDGIERLNKGDYTPHGYAFGFITCCNSLIRLGTIEEQNQLFNYLCGCGNDDVISLTIKYHNQQSADSRKMASEINIDDYKDDNIILVDIKQKTPLTGLVANKVMSSANKTVMLVNESNNGKFMGSCRSPIDAKSLCDNELFNFAKGHAHAFGIEFNAENFDKIIEYFNSLDKEQLVPQIDVITTLNGRSIPKSYFDIFKDYQYYGVGCPEPQFYIDNIELKQNDIIKYPTVMKFNFGGIDYVKFFATQNMYDELSSKCRNHMIGIVGKLGYNTYNGITRPQVVIDSIDYKPKQERSFEDIF